MPEGLIVRPMPIPIQPRPRSTYAVLPLMQAKDRAAIIGTSIRLEWSFERRTGVSLLSVEDLEAMAREAGHYAAEVVAACPPCPLCGHILDHERAWRRQLCDRCQAERIERLMMRDPEWPDVAIGGQQ